MGFQNRLTASFAVCLITSTLLSSTAIAQDDAVAKHDLTGQVLLPDGEAAPNAIVHLVTRPADGKKRTIRSVTANEDGEFHFDDMVNGTYSLVATSSGLASRIERLKAMAVSPGEQAIVLQLAIAPSLQVTVKSQADNKPISGAVVRLPFSDIKQEYATDENGEVTINGLSHQMWQVKVRAHRYAEQVYSANLATTNFGRVSALLEPGASLTGVVRNKAGKPVSNAGVSAYANSSAAAQTDFVRANENGVYRFDSLPLTELRLSVTADGYSISSPELAMTVEAGGQQTQDVTLTPLPMGDTIRGIVMDTDGDVIEGAKITNHGRRSSQVRSTESDSDGKFELTNLYNTKRLVFQAKGFSPLHMSITGKVTDPPNQIEVRLDPGHTIKGKTVDEQGDPLPGVRIVNDGRPGTRWRVYEVIKSDKNGNFSFDSLPKEAVLDFSKPGYSRVENKLLPLDGDDTVIVTIPDDGILLGRVVDNETGKPIRDFTVKISFSRDRKRGEPTAMLRGARVFEGEAFSHITGRFEMHDLVQKMPLQVTVDASGYERTVVRRVVTAKASEVEATIFRLKPIDMAKRFSIRGKLVDASGQGIPGINLRLIARKALGPRDRFRSSVSWNRILSGHASKNDTVKQFLIATTAKDGSFSFGEVDADNVLEIAYWGRGVVRERLKNIEDYSAGKQQDLVIRTTAGGNVKGKIDIQSFAGVWQITFVGSKGLFYAKLSRENGTYEINDLPPGDYEVAIRCESVADETTGYSESTVVQREKCQIESGESLEFDLKARKTPKQAASQR